MLVDGKASMRGLTSEGALARLRRDGPNALQAQPRRKLLGIALEVVREPMFAMLVAGGVLYLLMGEPRDAALLLGAVFAVMGITIVQERRTERALDALKDLTSPRALVIRDGERQRIPGVDVVQGDLVVLSEGDRVPADGLLRTGRQLSVDESLLTGESVPVRKLALPEGGAVDRPGGDDLPNVFSGTLVTAGQGEMEVTGTGVRTEIGRIGSALAQTESVPTPLQVETGRLVRLLAVAGLIACLVVVVVYGLTRGGDLEAWKQGFLAGITMAMAILPEEFPVVLTVFLALGAWRLSRTQVLTRRIPAVEILGAATVLCVDKTGTLTENRMSLARLVAPTGAVALDPDLQTLPEAVHSLLEHAILASRPDPFDPMERALHQAGVRFPSMAEHLHPDWSLAKAYPLGPELMAMSHAWRDGRPGEVVVATKGAPEAIAALCQLDAAATDALLAQVTALGAEGLRVLAVARTVVQETALPPDQGALRPELLGLLAFHDPLRASVPAAVARCQRAGVRVVMITGDTPATARPIARSAGIEGWETALTGVELQALDDSALADRIGQIGVFARVRPEQKLRIVQAFAARGDIVAMTGDGVNDAPALKAAHIGIAMGQRGTDVAREAASLVLLDDDFSSIVEAIAMGRRIYANIRKSIVFILAAHVPIVGLSMLPVFFPSWPLLMLPVHVVFLELVIDPACSLVFEAEAAEPDSMDRPPRDPNERLFSSRTLGIATLQGASLLAACLIVYLASRAGHPDDAARALTFATLVLGILSVIAVNRSWSASALTMLRAPNAALAWVLLGAALALALGLFTAPGQSLFHFAPVHPSDLALSAALGAACVGWFEGLKWVWRRSAQAPASPTRS